MTIAADLAAIGALMDAIFADRQSGMVLQVKLLRGADPTYLFKSESAPGGDVQFKQAQTLIDWLTSVKTGEKPITSGPKEERLARMKKAKEELDAAIAELEEQVKPDKESPDNEPTESDIRGRTEGRVDEVVLAQIGLALGEV